MKQHDGQAALTRHLEMGVQDVLLPLQVGPAPPGEQGVEPALPDRLGTERLRNCIRQSDRISRFQHE